MAASRSSSLMVAIFLVLSFLATSSTVHALPAVSPCESNDSQASMAPVSQSSFYDSVTLQATVPAASAQSTSVPAPAPASTATLSASALALDASSSQSSPSSSVAVTQPSSSSIPSTQAPAPAPSATPVAPAPAPDASNAQSSLSSSVSLAQPSSSSTPSTQAPAPASSAPQSSASTSAAGGYWMADSSMHDQILPIFGQNDSSYKLFRNVKDYGAVGDGTTDDTAAINKAMSDGNRCGLGCNSSTTSPAIVYFPAGSYLVSTPIQQYYYTQMIGDPTNLPTIVGAPKFDGMALIDSDPYVEGTNWYINQNNFYRQVRNFNIDLTQVGGGLTGAGIHWQVAQATSLQNINFKMSQASGTKQQGIFMDNGSGGFATDLTFDGGMYGAFLGSQQFTMRNMKFTNCKTAIYMNWNWGWTFHNISISGLGSNSSGIDMANSPQNQTVGSISVLDSTITNVEVGINSAFARSSLPNSGGTLVLRNVDISQGVQDAVREAAGSQMLAPGKISNWVAGRGYTGTSSGSRTVGTVPSSAAMPSGLLTSNGSVFGRSKPQYENVPASSFISAKSVGAKGDGKSDDTQAIQQLLTKVANTSNIAYFDYGAYRVTDTITVPPNVKIVGEIWSIIFADGFKDMSNPKPVFQIGKPGDTGSFEMSDMVFEVLGPNPGAIMIEYNLQSDQGQSGIWDSHLRLGGTYDSNLQLSQCAKNPSQTTADTNCEAAFLMFHATRNSSNLYIENMHAWLADHDFEDPLNQQISLYNGRGVLIQSQGPVWLWGTASEHSVIYNYQFDGVKALFAGFIQTETPYMQPNPVAPVPFTYDPTYNDPSFTLCSNSSSASVPCKDAWGLRVVGSAGVWIYSLGMYSFFNNYDQTCAGNNANNCQQNMIRVENSEVNMFAVSTKASVNMIYDTNSGAAVTVLDADNRSNFCGTVGYYLSSPR